VYIYTDTYTHKIISLAFIVYSFNFAQGVEPRWKGLNTAIPVIMVSKRAYTILVAESYSATTRLSFQEDLSVRSAVWEPLEKLVDGEGWPRSDAYVSKKYEQLCEEHKAWPDRLATVRHAFSLKVNGTSHSRVGTGLKSEL
jgi:hypothetical protein